MFFKNYKLEETVMLGGLGGGLGKRNFGNLKYPTRVHSWVRTDGRTETIAISPSLFQKMRVDNCVYSYDRYISFRK